MVTPNSFAPLQRKYLRIVPIHEGQHHWKNGVVKQKPIVFFIKVRKLNGPIHVGARRLSRGQRVHPEVEVADVSRLVARSRLYSRRSFLLLVRNERFFWSRTIHGL